MTGVDEPLQPVRSDELVELLNRAVERARGAECAHVQLIDDAGRRAVPSHRRARTRSPSGGISTVHHAPVVRRAGIPLTIDDHVDT